jgi:hypothetical protein
VFSGEAHRIQAESKNGMVVFDYVIWIANPTLFLLFLILMGHVSMLRLPAFQRGRARRLALPAWSGVPTKGPA